MVEYIVYEHAANELVRTCLRIEHCLSQLSFYCNNPADADSYHSLTAIIELLNVLDRPDLKSKLIQEIKRQQENFAKLSEHNAIDPRKLEATLQQLQQVLLALTAISGKFGDEIRSEKFIDHVRQSMLSSVCPLPSPLYQYWLAQPPEARICELLNWQQSFDTIRDATKLLLRLLRHSGQGRTEQSIEGFYQQPLDSNALPCQLVRVEIATEIKAFPEISIGKHRLCIRFLNPKHSVKTSQVEEPFEFKLTCCFV